MSPPRLALLLGLTLSTLATAAENDFDVSVGVTHLTRTDLALSPLANKGVMPRVGVGYQRRGDKWMHLAGIDLTIGSMRTQPSYSFTLGGDPYQLDASAITAADIQYAAGRRIDTRIGELVVGGTSYNHAADMVFVSGFLGDSHYLGAFELGPYVNWRTRSDKRHNLELSVWVPLAAWMARNPYSVHSARHIWNVRDPSVPLTVARLLADGEVQTLNRYQAVHTRATYRFDLHDHWTLAATARLDWLHHAVPHQLVELQLGADVALHGRF